MSGKRGRKDNPVGTTLFWLVLAMFAAIGLAVLDSTRTVFEVAVYPLIFSTALTFLVWVWFEYRSGIVHAVYSQGRTYPVHRKKEPVCFHLWIAAYTVAGIVVAVAFALLIFYDRDILR